MSMKVAILRLIVVGHLLFYDQIACSFTGGFYDIRWNTRQTGSVFDKLQDMNFIDCVDECLRRKRCGSVNYARRNLLCELNNIDTLGNILSYHDHVEVSPDYIHSYKSSWNANIIGQCIQHPCNINEKCVSKAIESGHYCKISDCGPLPTFSDADHVLDEGEILIGVGVNIAYRCTNSNLHAYGYYDFQMTCKEDGTWIMHGSFNCGYPGKSTTMKDLSLGAMLFSTPMVLENDIEWMVIQRRYNGHVDFFRDWTEYKNGFGSFDSEFWIGNEIIHELTLAGYTTLRIELIVDSVMYVGQYGLFRVEAENNGYRLQIDNFTGNLSQRMSYVNGMEFSTWDKDKDIMALHNCARHNRAGWWYRDCHQGNLNGPYGVRHNTGVCWLMDSFVYPSHVIMMVTKS